MRGTQRAPCLLQALFWECWEHRDTEHSRIKQSPIPFPWCPIPIHPIPWTAEPPPLTLTGLSCFLPNFSSPKKDFALCRAQRLPLTTTFLLE